MNQDKYIERKLVSIIKKYSTIVIYGAGTIGKRLYDFIDDNELQCDICFAETDIVGKEAYICGIPLKSINSCCNIQGKFLVIVAVREELMEQMLENLRRLHIQNVLPLNDEIRYFLRKRDVDVKHHIIQYDNLLKNITIELSQLRQKFLEQEVILDKSKIIQQDLETRVKLLEKELEDVNANERSLYNQNAWLVQTMNRVCNAREHIGADGLSDKTPIVSVIVPIYNTEKYLYECLESLLNQEMYDIEIICVNDGSTDGSEKIIKEFCERDSRVRLIHKENSGYGNTMNIGIANAKGEYIAILESDDFALPGMISDLYTAAVCYTADVVVGRYFVYNDETGKRELTSEFNRLSGEGILNKEEREKVILAPPSIWKGIYRKRFLIDCDIRFLETPGASYQDTSFAFKTIMSGSRVAAIKKPVLCYRRGHETASVKSNQKVFCVCDEFSEIKKYILENNFERWKTTYCKALFKRYIWNYNRLRDENAVIFRKRFLEEIQQLQEEGWLVREQWSDWEWNKLEEFKNLTIL